MRESGRALRAGRGDGCGRAGGGRNGAGVRSAVRSGIADSKFSALTNVNRVSIRRMSDHRDSSFPTKLRTVRRLFRSGRFSIGRGSSGVREKG
jgi:hypothetical protein